MNDRPIHYEPHPVSAERKAELIKQGFRIVDAKFKPQLLGVDATHKQDTATAAKKPKGRRA